MEYKARLAAQYTADNLEKLIDRVHLDTLVLVDKGEIPPLVTHFHAVRESYRDLKEKMERLESEVNELSYTLIPQAFDSQKVKTIKIDGIGRVTVAVRWVASMINKTAGMDWLRANNAGSLIIETVNAQTLASHAKAEALAGKPLPEDVFTVGIANYTSITKD